MAFVAGDNEGTLLAFSQWGHAPDWRVRAPHERRSRRVIVVLSSRPWPTLHPPFVARTAPLQRTTKRTALAPLLSSCGTHCSAAAHHETDCSRSAFLQLWHALLRCSAPRNGLLSRRFSPAVARTAPLQRTTKRTALAPLFSSCVTHCSAAAHHETDCSRSAFLQLCHALLRCSAPRNGLLSLRCVTPLPAGAQAACSPHSRYPVSV
jgi:hypothetical protein